MTTEHGTTTHLDLPLEQAVSAAQELADTDMAEIGGRPAEPKRKIHRRGTWTPRQYNHAGAVGIKIVNVLKARPGIRSGELEDLIDAHVASRLIDPIVGKQAGPARCERGNRA